MKKILLIGFVPLVLLFVGSCATTQTWPDYERNSEIKMDLIKQKIGDGLKSGALTDDQSQMFLARLKAIRTDYEGLRGRAVHRDEWRDLMGRLDRLSDDVERAMARQPKYDRIHAEDRISAIQRRIDELRISGRITPAESRDFQDRLDAIRNDYYRTTERTRPTTYDEDIYRRLDLLESDLNRFR